MPTVTDNVSNKVDAMLMMIMIMIFFMIIVTSATFIKLLDEITKWKATELSIQAVVVQER